MDENCTHLGQINAVTASAPGCEDCLRTGDRWVHLRVCLTCGHVGCCDESKNKHATKHFRATGHPVIQSFEPDEEWLWCYVDRLYWEEPPVPVKVDRPPRLSHRPAHPPGRR